MCEFYERNKEILKGEWINAWKEFCDSVKDLYIEVVSKAFAEGYTKHEDDRFGAFLNCEAHTDVWRELFKTYNHTNCI